MSRRGGNDTSAFNTSGLASNLPRPSEMNRWSSNDCREESGETTGGTQSTAESRPREEQPAAWRREPSTRDAAPVPREPSGWGSRPPRINRDDSAPASGGIDGVQDKFSKAFSRQSSAVEPPSRDLPRNSRGDFRDGGFGGPSRQDSGGVGSRREESGGFGGARRDEGRPAFGGSDSRRGFDSNPPPLRENSRNFGDRDSLPPRENAFGGAREGSGFGQRSERDGGEGTGGMRREFSSNNRRETDNSWAEDSRFASKFGRSGDSRQQGDDRGGRGGGGGGGRYDDHRRERDALNPNYRREMADMPLPTAPRATLGNNPMISKENVFQMALSTAKGTGKKQQKENKKKPSNNNNKKDALSPIAQPTDEDNEPEQPKEDAKGETMAAVATAVAQGLKGGALTDAVCSLYAEKGLTSPMSTHGLMIGILQAVDTGSYPSWAAGWFTANDYGDLLKYEVTAKYDPKQSKTLDAHVDALYGVQEFCASKKFPKVEVKGKERRLIEVIFSVLSLANIIDVDALIGWADDVRDRDDVPGRVDAIVQTTNFIASLRENDEEEEADDEVDAPRDFVK